MATIRDVARRAGVAPSTVSYVFNGSRTISEETRRRVQEAVDALGYHPRASARTLRSSRTQVIALAVPRAAGLQRSVDGRFAIDVSDAANALGYDLLLTTSQEKTEGLRRVALSGLADAAVLMAVDLEDARIGLVRELSFPAALIGRPTDEGALPWTDLDWEAAAALAVRELVAAGHRDLVYLSPVEAEVAARRSYALRGIAGAGAGARESGRRVEIVRAVAEPAAMTRRLHALLRPGPDRPTALVVQHPSADHVVASAAAAGLRVPEDLTVVVLGALPGDAASRSLPRVELPVERLSKEVVRLAVAAADAARERPENEPRQPGPSATGVLLSPVLLPGDAPLSASRTHQAR
ncbi:LacI family DNA-binding transcriptional regulator [Streptomyces tsukubensis]|uniref:Transcriptional regulator n=1 Tax=Streptomyces tsukubensis TaxID=83656 RepID=A0A1V4AFX3_9ACTN|nr:LacI family DNA-binding transcriptional regulator [Streptomyces tsukubensis]OON82926.1 transcriptional regulator [Streptomyces tsukubensis]QFR91890.1 LacI family DNA-binding transcriptional regulator [Streptomyces tsukubensis]